MPNSDANAEPVSGDAPKPGADSAREPSLEAGSAPGWPHLDEAAILASVGEAIICADAAGRIVFFNAAAEESFGYRAEEVHGQSVGMLLPERFRHAHQRQVSDFASGSGAQKRSMGRPRQVWGRRKTGEEFPADATISRQVIGGQTYVTVAHRDVTAQSRIDEDRELVAAELSHRIKNLLTVVHSLVALSAKGAKSVEGFAQSLQDRLLNLRATQDLMNYRDGASASLGSVLTRELDQYRSDAAANLSIKGPHVDLNPSAALTLGLAFHELATNAAKYGALSGPTGRVDLEWKLVDEENQRLLAIGWHESGGPPVSPPTRRGFGTTLIQDAIRRKYRAQVVVDYAPEGLTCRMTLPLDQIQPGAN